MCGSVGCPPSGRDCPESATTPLTVTSSPQTSAPHTYASAHSFSRGGAGRQWTVIVGTDWETSVVSQARRMAEAVINSVPWAVLGKRLLSGRQELGELLPTPLTLDSRNKVAPAEWERAAWKLHVLLGAPTGKIGELLPTITAQGAKSNGGPAQYARNTWPLNALAGGPLNPRWVEWLMGFPIGWHASGRSVTLRFREWLRLHGEC